MNISRYLFTDRDFKRLIFPFIADLLLQALVGLTDSVMVASACKARQYGRKFMQGQEICLREYQRYP